MQSAFGIDHVEISKVARPPKKLAGWRGRPTAAQTRTAGTNGKGTRTKAAAAKLNRIGEADVSLKGIGSGIGAGATRAGAFFQRHPGLTGTAAVGGGGAAGYKILSDKEPKRRRGGS